MRGHDGERQRGGRLHQDRSAPPGRPIGVPPQIGAEARGADKIHDEVVGVVRVGKVERARHGLKAKGVVVNVHRRGGDGGGAILRSPPGGRLDGIQHL